ncbi:leucine-rich repeat domain-containing protein [Herbidospora sp. NEAU-GS84]|uniref:Leucine-rich repeat domain-containing protein n=1 Tax=Herbidospora solisilvae TaxID=2696284 RepID=A0A7C9NYM6_9ACTN|nr:STM4015 family protein [Herbidospora solisilvae]NAS20817.1 leucine-rich repeat domain-containing protein [Herbidospora solisilvae]
MTISLDLPRHTDDTDVYYRRYAGLPTVDFFRQAVHPPGEVAWELGCDDLDDFFDAVDPAQVRALVVGGWDADADAVVERLVAEAHRLPALRALFFGAIPQEALEISWINQTDVTPLLTAFPDLERLETRGGMGLRLSPVRHERLRMLRAESGGLDGDFVRGVAACRFPALEHLELWLGVEEYGGDYTVDDLAPILSGDHLPALKHLGLQDSDRQDDVAAAVATAPIVARLDGLALSMGTLTDDGAEALLSGQPLTHLRRLDLHHHYLSDAMMARLRAALGSVDLDLEAQGDPDEFDGWLFTSVNE